MGVQKKNLLPVLCLSSIAKNRTGSGEHHPEHAAAGARCQREAYPDSTISSALMVAEEKTAEP